MSLVCPTVLAPDAESFKQQMTKISHLGHRLQIDLTDGQFAPTKTVTPSEIWWPAGFKADVHLMYKNPAEAMKDLLVHPPHMIIIHAEAGGIFKEFAATCKANWIKVGVALLPQTDPGVIDSALPEIDHVLIFSGDLGSFGGHADLSLLEKVKNLKSKKPYLEIGWDGGVNLQNVAQLVYGGVDVLNVGGYIQKAEDPAKAYNDLARIADETGTT